MDCLGHEGTLNLLESWREILRERQVRDDEEIKNNNIIVSVGPQYEGDISRSENIKKESLECLQSFILPVWIYLV